MVSFEDGFSRCCLQTDVSEELRPLLARVYALIHGVPVDVSELKNALLELLSFLCEPANRSEANCRVVDLFFAVDDHWNVRWDVLPDEYGNLLDDIGGSLHDTVSAPEVAENFAATPELLLDRARRLRT